MAQEDISDPADFSVKTNSLWYEPDLHEHFRADDRRFFKAYVGLEGEALDNLLYKTVSF